MNWETTVENRFPFSPYPSSETHSHVRLRVPTPYCDSPTTRSLSDHCPCRLPYQRPIQGLKRRLRNLRVSIFMRASLRAITRLFSPEQADPAPSRPSTPARSATPAPPR